jgi:hypothetical protein
MVVAVSRTDIPVTEARIIVVENTAQVHNLITCSVFMLTRSILSRRRGYFQGVMRAFGA